MKVLFPAPEEFFGMFFRELMGTSHFRLGEAPGVFQFHRGEPELGLPSALPDVHVRGFVFSKRPRVVLDSGGWDTFVVKKCRANLMRTYRSQSCCQRAYGNKRMSGAALPPPWPCNDGQSMNRQSG
jgi:hypothetical protein